MKIAIISFGSLLKKSKGLSIGKWNSEGPVIPLQLSRISKDGRLVLCIDEKNGVANKTFFAISKMTNLEKAIKQLMKKEKITTINRIGFIDLKNKKVNAASYEKRKKTCETIGGWAAKNKIDAVIYSDLGPKFKLTLGVPFSQQAAYNYVKNLKNATKALDYIRNIPAQIKLPIVDMLTLHLGKGKKKLDKVAKKN